MSVVLRQFLVPGNPIGRAKWWLAWVVTNILGGILNYLTWGEVVSVPLWLCGVALAWVLVASSINRADDQEMPRWWLFAFVIPVLGYLWLMLRLGFVEGAKQEVQ